MSEYKSEVDKYVESLLNESRDIAASNINNMLKEQLAQSSNGNNECAGTYYVSGYKREDGTEVNGYMRTCGAEHNGNKSNSLTNNNPEHNYVLQGNISKSNIGENIRNYLRENSQIYNDYDRLSTDEKIQKFITQTVPLAKWIPIQEYYKIALDLVDNTNRIKNNERNSFYKASDLPGEVDKNTIYNKIIKTLDLDMNDTNDIQKLKNTTVVIPKGDSQIARFVHNSNILKEVINENIDELKSGKEINISISFPFDLAWQKVMLFGTIHSANIKFKLNSDGTITGNLIDVFDFKYEKERSYNSFIDHFNLKKILYNKAMRANNRAWEQQKAGKLKPYVLYIPINIQKSAVHQILTNF